jgi:hypothetical protein
MNNQNLHTSIKQYNPENEEDFEESESNGGWISWFCELEGHDFFAEVDSLNIDR